MSNEKHECGIHLVKIHGKELKDSVELMRHLKSSGKFSSTNWVYLCPSCDAVGLGSTARPLPFVCIDEVMRTVDDFDRSNNEFNSDDIDFVGFWFSKSALHSAADAARRFDDGSEEELTTEFVENLGKGVQEYCDVASSLKFSKAVCDWGRGQRVWGNLKRHYESKEALGQALANWFLFAAKTDNDEEAIERGINIKGLQVSFASKHLRMLRPQRYAVLDEIISEGLGFAPNPKGYAFYMRSLRSFFATADLGFKSVGDFELALFNLVRQKVRARENSHFDA